MVLYQEWHIGKNNLVQQGLRRVRRIQYGTDDYINLNDVDGVEVILLD